MSIRSAGYSVNEDILLCRMHLDISQDPITGINQSREQFWARVEVAYNDAKEVFWESRTKKSLLSRMQTIDKAVRKLNGCVRQIENLRPSGASDQDILTQAKTLLMQDPNFKKGFKFDHVWAIMKDFEKFNDGDLGRKKPRKQGYANISSESETPTPDSPYLSSPNLSSFSLNLNEDIAGDSTSSQRPSGVKKAKMKRKIDEGYMKIIQSENTRIVEAMNNATETKKEVLYVQKEIQKEKIRLKELKEENKTMLIDVDSIADPIRREFYRQEQHRIIYKRSQQFSQPQAQQSSAPFTQYYNDVGVSGNDIPPY